MALVDSAPVTFQILVFALGCCLGSFYNVVIHRLPRSESLVSPGREPRLREHIEAYDNSRSIASCCSGPVPPLRSFLFDTLSAVEAATGVFALLLFRRYGLHPQLGIEFIFLSLLLIIALRLDTFLIPDVCPFPESCSDLRSPFSPRAFLDESLLGIFLGAACSTGCYGIRAGAEKRGHGRGDIKLTGSSGHFWAGRE